GPRPPPRPRRVRGEDARDPGRAQLRGARAVRLLGAPAPVASAHGGAHAVEKAGLRRRRRAGFAGEPPSRCTGGYGRIPKGGERPGGNHRQFSVLWSVSEGACVAQDDHPKSWDGTLWARGARASTRSARTETTP